MTRNRLIDRFKFKPTKAPYRIEKTRPALGQRWVDRYLDDPRIAMSYLMQTRPGTTATLFDADGVFIASVDATDTGKPEQ